MLPVGNALLNETERFSHDTDGARSPVVGASDGSGENDAARGQFHYHLLYPLLWVILINLSCKEPLPPYEDPRNVFEGSLDPEYVYAFNDNSLKIRFAIKNKFDETLQARAVLTGSLQISLRRNPDFKRTFFLSASNLVQATNYNPNSRILTINPGDSIRFGVSWNFLDDNGRDLRQEVFRYVPDPMCILRRIAAREIYVLRAEVKIFDRTEDVSVGSVAFAMCHINAWIDPKQCPLLLPGEACARVE